MKSSRRSFNRTLAMGAMAAPLATEALAQGEAPSIAEATELRMKIIDVKVSEARAKQIREFLRTNTTREIAAIRAFPLKRDVPPALGLGVFDV